MMNLETVSLNNALVEINDPTVAHDLYDMIWWVDEGIDIVYYKHDMTKWICILTYILTTFKYHHHLYNNVTRLI